MTLRVVGENERQLQRSFPLSLFLVNNSIFCFCLSFVWSKVLKFYSCNSCLLNIPIVLHFSYTLTWCLCLTTHGIPQASAINVKWLRDICQWFEEVTICIENILPSHHLMFKTERKYVPTPGMISSESSGGLTRPGRIMFWLFWLVTATDIMQAYGDIQCGGTFYFGKQII